MAENASTAVSEDSNFIAITADSTYAIVLFLINFGSHPARREHLSSHLLLRTILALEVDLIVGQVIVGV